MIDPSTSVERSGNLPPRQSSDAAHNGIISPGEEEIRLAREWSQEMNDWWRRTYPAGKVCPNYDLEEYRLVHNFKELVDGMELPGIIHLEEGRKKPPRNIGRYNLVALEAADYTHSRYAAHEDLRSVKREGVEFNCYGEGSKPWLDTGFAIGLVYEGTASAVASAFVTYDRTLRISQIQAIAAPPDPSDEKSKYKSGLHGGFLWRDTLVQAWIEVAREIGVSTVEIEGAANNQWLDQKDGQDDRTELEWQQQFFDGYDRVAERMGFSYNEQTRNWQLDLAETPDAAPVAEQALGKMAVI